MLEIPVLKDRIFSMATKYYVNHARGLFFIFGVIILCIGCIIFYGFTSTRSSVCPDVIEVILNNMGKIDCYQFKRKSFVYFLGSNVHISQVTKVRLSCYLDLLSVDSKTRYKDSRTFMTWPICSLTNLWWKDIVAFIHENQHVNQCIRSVCTYVVIPNTYSIHRMLL